MLAVLFQKFINRFLKIYGLCLSYYFNGPARSWDAILTLMRIELDFVSEVETHLFLEKCMRGGASYVSKRYSKANTKYLTFYNPKN